MTTAPSATTLLEIRGVDHHFGGVHAVDDVSLEFVGGEVCALLGENGAGKSTLMKAVAGALRTDRGQVLLDRRPLPAGDPGATRRRGISLIYQELNLVGALPVYENIALGRETRRRIFVDHRAEKAHAAELLTRLDAGFDPEALVESLSVAEQQLVEIAKALSIEARVLIMDEPTSALSEREAGRLFDVVRRLAGRGVAIILITHRLEEVALLADRVVVMRDGAVVAQGPGNQFDRGSLIQAMVGRELDRQFPGHRARPGGVVLRVAGLAAPPHLAAASFEVRGGEIVALAGLVGSGRTEVGRALFGIDRPAAGKIEIDGKVASFRHPREAIAAGIGWVSEDRKGEGLVLSMSVLANLTLPHLERYARLGRIDAAAERRAAAKLIDRLSIRTVGPDQGVAELSGGNQQKVAFARWLLHDCRLLICDEPTRGVDAGGRFEIYELLAGLVERGVAVLMISSDLEEVLGMADRIVVLHDGRSRPSLDRAEATQERLLHLATGSGT